MMTTWYSLNLGDGMMAAMPSAEIQALFLKKFADAGNPSDMAVFTRHESGSLHCEVIAYFSPAASEIAKAFDAQPIEKPLRSGLGLLAGESDSWSALFTESNE
jgi:hypothetical protein